MRFGAESIVRLRVVPEAGSWRRALEQRTSIWRKIRQLPRWHPPQLPCYFPANGFLIAHSPASVARCLRCSRQGAVKGRAIDSSERRLC